MANSIGFDPVAWSVDGGRHNGELYRVLAYAATAGAEGIVSAPDCKVHQLSTPGGQVAVDAGALLIRNRSANVRNQTYAANGRTETRLDIRPTGAESRSDLIIVRIEDPQYAPWSAVPAGEAPTFQYVRPIVIEGVSANTINFWSLNLGYSGYALARVDIPANTTVITDAMVKDLRALAQPRRHRVVKIYTPGDIRYAPAAGAPRGWFPRTDVGILCPEWATRVQMVVTYTGLRFDVGDITGHTRAEYGWATGDVPGEGDTEGLPMIATQYTGLHYEWSGGADRKTVVIAGDLAIPASYRGKVHQVRTGTKINANWLGRVTADEWTTIVVDMEFVEVPN